MNKLKLSFIVLVFCTIQSYAQESLYKRLGGYDAIAAVSDDFLGRLAADKDLFRFFMHLDTDAIQRSRQLIVDQICNATGGHCVYIGRSMKASHQGMKISEKDWGTTVTLFIETLTNLKYLKKKRKSC